MLPRGDLDGVVPVHPLLRSLYLFRQIFTAAVYGKKLLRGAFNRNAVFVDSLAVLRRRVGKAGGGRYSAGRWRHAPVSGGDIYGFDFACRAGLCVFRPDGKGARDLVRMACRLDGGDVSFCLFLPQGIHTDVKSLDFGRQTVRPRHSGSRLRRFPAHDAANVAYNRRLADRL